MEERGKQEMPEGLNREKEESEEQKRGKDKMEKKEQGVENLKKEGAAGGGTKSLSANLSVWALLAGGSFYKILLVLALMLPTECILFYRALYGGGMEGGFAEVLRRSCAYPIFLAALGVIFLILVRLEGMLDSRSRYILMRLRVTRTRIFVVETVYNVLCLAVLFALQIGAAFWMVWLYADAVGAEYTGGQLLFLTFYRNNFLHCLLPMADTWKWLRNVLLLLALGMSAACGVEAARRKYVIPISLYVVTVCTFASRMGIDGIERDGLDWWCGGLSFAAIVVASVDVLRRYRMEKG